MDITTLTGRKKLPPRREPYWHRLALGHYVGYRVLPDGLGTWIARLRTEDKKQRYHALGSHDDFDKAARLAKSWIENYLSTGIKEKITIEEACKLYIQDSLRDGRANASRIDKRLRKTVYGTAFGRLAIDDAKVTDFENWIHAFTGMKNVSKAREFAPVRAALNSAYRRELCTSQKWNLVKPLKKDSEPRTRSLSADERRRLLACSEPSFRAFAEALLLSAARPGAMASIRVKDLDMKTGTLHYPKDKTGPRSVPVSGRLSALIKEHSKGKLPNALVFERQPGEGWNSSNWSKAIIPARRSAGLGDEVIVYTLRHTAISEMIIQGIDTLTVARLAGTSILQIDRHYGHLCQTRTKQLLDGIVL